MIPRISIVLAVQEAAANVELALERLDLGRHPDVELLVCTADPLPVEPAAEQVKTIRCPAETLIPGLWARGIEAARAPLVATTTAHCLPEPGWVDGLLEIDPAGPAATGGVIAPDPGERAHSRAIYLMRYLPYQPPGRAGQTREVAADNAAYRRDAILDNRDLLVDGFWEPSFHERFRAAGLKMVMDPRLVVRHANCYGMLSFARQRFAHGQAFGAARIGGLSLTRRWVFALAAPLLPGVFLARLLARAARFRSGGVAGALPCLLLYVAYWGAGEASAYWRGLARPR